MTQSLPRLPHRSQLRIQQLNMVLRLIEHRSISGAAADLRLSQSAVTKSLQEIESIFGVMLFHREPRGLRPTRYCAVVERFARDVVLGLDGAIDALGALMRGERGQVSIGARGGLPQRVAAEAIARFRLTHPQVHVRVTGGSSMTLLAQVESGCLDFALVPLPLQLERQLFSHLRAGQEDILAVVHPEHPLRRVPGADAAALLDAVWVLPPRGEPLRERLESMWTSLALDEPHCALEAGSHNALLELASSQDAIGIVSESQALPYLQAGRLITLPMPFVLPRQPWGLIRSRHRSLQPEAVSALQCVTAHVRQMRIKRHRRAGFARNASAPAVMPETIRAGAWTS